MAFATYLDAVQKLYIAFYQRPADPAGLRYWAQRVDAAGGDQAAAIDAFATSAEAQALYGTIDKDTIGTVIDKIYLALFNRVLTADDAGKKFYVDGFNAGTFTAGSIALNVLNGAANDDAVAVANKLGVANEFTKQVDGRALTDAGFGTGTAFNVTYSGDTDATNARDILKAVTSSPSSILNASQVTETIKTKIADATDPIMGQTGGQTFTLTAGIDNIVGTSGNDTIIGGNGAGTTTGPADQIDGGAGNDTFKFYGGLITGNMPTIKNVENLYFNATNGTLNAAGIAGVETVEIENAGGAHTVTLGAAQKLTLTNINGATGTTVQGTTAGGITLNNVVDKTVTPNVAQALNVNTRDTSLTLNAVNAASNVTLLSTSAGAAAAADMAALTKLTVTGDAKLTVTAGGALNYTNLTTVDASANTGGVDFRQVQDTNLTFTGGTGNDRVQVAAAAIVAQDKLDGGEGKDTLAITTGGLTAPAVANVQNFEVLEVRGSAAPLTQDASVFDAKNTWEGLTVVNTGGAQTFTVTNLAATAKDGIVVNAGATGNTTTLTTTVKGFLNGGTSDSATVTVNADATTLTATPSVTTLTFDNVDNLTLVSKSTAATAANQITVNATDMEKLTVTGNIQTTVLAGTSTGITEVDASGLVVANGLANGLTFTQAAGATQSLLVTGSNGADTITVFSDRGTVIANGGNDNIIFNTAANAAAGSQSVNLSAKDFVGNGALTVNFAAFTAGGNNEVINFSSDIEAMLKIGGVNLGTTTANQAVGAAINGQNNVALVDVAGVATLQFDVNGDGNFNAADDFAITLTGLSSVGAGAISVTYDAAADWFVIA